MAAKGNIRSIRISDDMAELIDRQAGSNFTEKWENLVTRCVWELPQKKEQLKSIQVQIDRERQRLQDLRTANEELRRFEQSIRTAQYYINQIEQRGKITAEAAEKASNTD